MRERCFANRRRIWKEFKPIGEAEVPRASARFHRFKPYGRIWKEIFGAIVTFLLNVTGIVNFS